MTMIHGNSSIRPASNPAEYEGDQSKPTMTTMKLMVTPAQAREFLRGNRNNRPLRRSYVADLAKAITDGKWRVTHQGIALTTDMRLIDGQHRCAAIVLADVPVEMNVSFDCDPDSFVVLDTGKRRSAAYALDVRSGEASALRWLVALSESELPIPQRVTVIDLEGAKSWGMRYIRALMEACGSARRVASSAPVIAGISLRMSLVENWEEILAAFRAFILLEYASMPGSVQVLERQIATGTATTHSPRILLIKAFTAFDLGRGDKTLLVRDETVMLGRLHQIAMTMRYGKQVRFSLDRLIMGKDL